MHSLWRIILFTLVISSGLIMAQSHQIFTEVLKKYVKNGLVDYKNLKKDNRLEKYLSQLSNTNPEKLSKNEKIAFWINAYNAFTLKVIVENYPVESITDLNTGGKIIGYLLGKTVWDKEYISINKKKYSLGDIEHKILRKMNEPRIHFSIVCASISCPSLRNEAFEAIKLEEQLKSQAVQFVNDNARNYFDVKKRKAYLSKIFSWFREDFGGSDEKILQFVSQYLSGKNSLNIKNKLSQWDISYKDYNWHINEQK